MIALPDGRSHAAINRWLKSGSMQATIALIGRIGFDSSDSDDTRLRKRLAVVLCAGTLPLTLLWSAIYLAVGAPIASADPLDFGIACRTLGRAHGR